MPKRFFFFAKWTSKRLLAHRYLFSLFILCLTAPFTYAQVTEEWARRYSLTFSYANIEASSMTVDEQGNVYVTGNSLADAVNTDTDIITIKFNAEGKQQWIRRFDSGMNKEDQARAITVDGQGNVYVLGSSPVFDNNYNLPGITTIKYSSNGQEQWVAQESYVYGSSPNAITVDGQGNVYVTGIMGEGQYASPSLRIVKYSSTGITMWRGYFNPPSGSNISSSFIALDGSGNVFVICSSGGNSTATDYVTLKYTSVGIQQWIRRYNGPTNGDDYARAIALDAQGNIYVTGSSEGGATSMDYATVKYNASGTQQWVQRYNGPANGEDTPTSIALDTQGNIYVTGTSNGGSAFMDYATIKYTPSGSQQWMRRYNHSVNGNDYALRIRIDGEDNVYITGTSYGGNTSTDYATIKYSPNGTQQWVQRYTNQESTTSEQARAMVLDAQGSIYIVGTSTNSISTNFASVKYNSSGIEQWVWAKKAEISNIDSGKEEKATAMAVDGQGNVYVTGVSIGENSAQDYTTIKYSPNGTELWVSNYDGPVSWNDYPTAIALDSQGNVYVTGYSYVCHTTSDVCDPRNPNSYFQINYATIKYSPDGIQRWVRYYDGGQEMDDKALAISADQQGNIYVTGTSFGKDSNGIYSNDFVTLKYTSAGTELWVKRLTSSSTQGYYDQPTAMAVDRQGNVYVTGSSNVGSTSDYATVKYNTNGAQQWVKSYNGPANGKDAPVGIKVDGSGNVYVTGSSEGSSSGEDYALVKYNAGGSQAWVKRYHSSYTDQAKDLAVDKNGNIYVTGVSRGSNNGIVYRTLKYNTEGTVQWIKSYGDGTYPGTTQQVALTVDAGNNIYLAGSDSLGAQARYIVVKYGSDGSQHWQYRYQNSINSQDVARAVALDGQGNVYVTGSSNSDYLTLKLNQTTLPSPWKNTDIGAVAISGSASYSNSVFTVRSSGFDFYRAPDAFHYVYQPITGDATIIAKVESMDKTHPYALAGVMMRENLNASASFVAVAVNPSNYTNFMWRQGSGTPGYKAVSGSAPKWLKLSRSGNSFTSAYSADGVNWITISTINISMGSNLYAGLALTSQNNLQLNTATFSNVSVSPIPPVCSATGTILQEYWANVSGGYIYQIPLTSGATSSSLLTSFETSSNQADNYGERIRGYICAPETGNYIFYLASDDHGELWLSKNDDSSNKELIAYVSGHTNARQWSKYASQKSVSITLEKGKRYYIEALHKEAIYSDNLAVGWTIPGSSSIQVIPGSVLSPFALPASRLASDQYAQQNEPIEVYPNPFENKLMVVTQGQPGKLTLSLTDILGKVYLQKEYSLTGQAEVELNLPAESVKTGIYLLRLQFEDGHTRVIKVVKK